MTKQYRLVVGTHGRQEGAKGNTRSVVYKAGVEGRDVMDNLTDAEVESFGNRIEPVDPNTPYDYGTASDGGGEDTGDRFVALPVKKGKGNKNKR